MNEKNIGIYDKDSSCVYQFDLSTTEITYKIGDNVRKISLTDLIQFVEDVSSHGLRVDTSPTIGGKINANNATDMYMQMSNYLKHAEDELKARAQQTLGLHPKPVAEYYGEDDGTI